MGGKQRKHSKFVSALWHTLSWRTQAFNDRNFSKQIKTCNHGPWLNDAYLSLLCLAWISSSFSVKWFARLLLYSKKPINWKWSFITMPYFTSSKVQSKFSRNSVKIQSKFSQNSVKIQLKFSQNSAKIQSKKYKQISVKIQTNISQNTNKYQSKCS